MAIEHPWVSKAIENFKKKLKEETLKYGNNYLNLMMFTMTRLVIYDRRNQILKQIILINYAK